MTVQKNIDFLTFFYSLKRYTVYDRKKYIVLSYFLSPPKSHAPLFLICPQGKTLPDTRLKRVKCKFDFNIIIGQSYIL